MTAQRAASSQPRGYKPAVFVRRCCKWPWIGDPRPPQGGGASFCCMRGRTCCKERIASCQRPCKGKIIARRKKMYCFLGLANKEMNTRKEASYESKSDCVKEQNGCNGKRNLELGAAELAHRVTAPPGYDFCLHSKLHFSPVLYLICLQ